MIQKRQFYSLNFMKMTVLSSELSTDNTYDAAILCATLTFWASLLKKFWNPSIENCNDVTVHPMTPNHDVTEER